MASSSVLDLDALVGPVAGDDPAGDRNAYAYRLRDQILQLRKEERPEDFDDATRPAELKKADWRGVVETASAALVGESKDLRIACHLVEGLVKTQGFAGLRDGLALVRRLVDECWERLAPPVDNGDVTTRSEPLANMLDDPQRGACLPNTVRSIPLIGPPQGGLGLNEWSKLRAARDPASVETVTKALVATPPERLEELLRQINGCLVELDDLVPLFDVRMGSEAPGLTNLRSAVADCRFAVDEELARMHGGPAPGPPEPPAPGASPATATGPSPPSAPSPAAGGPRAAVASRLEAYRKLNEAAELLEQIEPHSPIPYLVKRAVQLGRLPFPGLMEQLIRDSGVLAELKRELGVGPADEAAAGGR